MIGNRIGNSLPLLNYSDHPDYGVEFGANFIAPDVTFGSKEKNILKMLNPITQKKILVL